MNAVAGDVFSGRFEIQHRAGSGGMGTVYRAHDRLRNRPVALKILDLAAGGEERERFEREARLLAECQHPGIVRYVGHGVSPQGMLFLTMEWLEGEDLAQRLRRGPLSVAQGLVLLRRVAQALAAVHSRGILHRDLKPNNLFLRSGDIERVTLLDFGIARRSVRAPGITRTGLIIGTPEYMSPEQMRGARELDPATDIFSLGCVIYECLTGSPPFATSQLSTTLAKLLFADAPHLRDDQAPPRLQALLARMLARDPARRPRDADQLLTELDSDPVSAAPAAARAVPAGSAVLTTHEQRLVSVLVASAEGPSGEASTLDPGQSAEHQMRMVSLQLMLERHGAHVEILADRSLVATYAAEGQAATDQAALAACNALLLKQSWPEAVVALSTGRGVMGQGLPLGEALERVGRIVRSSHASAYAPAKCPVLVDDVTAGLLGAGFKLQRASVIRDAGIELFELLGEGSCLGEERSLLGRVTTCVGRDRELGMLELLLDGCIEDSRARIALISGPAGLGKSLLCHEFLRRTTGRPGVAAVLQGCADVMNRGTSLSALGQVLRRLCKIQSSQSPAEQRQALARRLGPEVPEAERQRVVELLGELCGVPFPGAARREVKLLQTQLAQAFADFLHAECRRGAVILVLDDVHRIDALTLDLLNAAMRRVRDQPVLVLALVRSEAHPVLQRLRSLPAVQEVAVSPLSRRACERLVKQALGPHLLPSKLAGIVRLSTGNPLFLEELIRATAEGQDYQQTATVRAILQARLSQLPTLHRQVLRAASVFGEIFWRGGLVRLLACAAAELEAALTCLIDLEYIRKHPHSRFDGEAEYGFRHSLTHDAVYALLTEDDRRTGHLTAARYLAEVAAQETQIIAEHFQRGGDVEQAARYFRATAEKCYERHDPEGMLQQAKQGQAGASGEDRGVLCAIECVAQAWRLEWEAALLTGEKALGLLPVGSLWWCRAIQQIFLMMPACVSTGRCGELIELFSRARPTDESLGAYTAAAAQLVTTEAFMGDSEHSLAFLIFLEQATAPRLHSDLLVRAWTAYAQGWFAGLLSPDPRLAVKLSQQSVEAFQQAHARHGLVQAQILHGLALTHIGALDEGRESLRGAYAEAQKLNDPLLTRFCQVHLALALSLHRDPATLKLACALARFAITDKSSPALLGVAYGALARALFRLAEPAQAAATARHAYQLLATERLYQAEVAVTLLQALLAQGQREEALRIAEQSLDLLASIGGAGWAEVPLRLEAAAALAEANHLERARVELAAALRQLGVRAAKLAEPASPHRVVSNVEANILACALSARLLASPGAEGGIPFAVPAGDSACCCD